MNPDLKTFKRLAKKGNVIPVYEEILADLETPVAAFLKVASGDYAYLLESVESQENIGRYSFLAAQPSLVFESKGRRVTVRRLGRSGYTIERSVETADPLAELRALTAGLRFVAVDGLPRFCGGLVGYMGYDMVRFFERLPDGNPDDLKAADCLFMLSDTVLIFDHVNRTLKIVANAILRDKAPAAVAAAYAHSRARIAALLRRLKQSLPGPAFTPRRSGGVRVTPNITPRQYKDAVRKAKEYIRKGDIIQVVLSQRFSAPLKTGSFDIYRSLRAINPSPYMFYLKMRDLVLVGSSPELLVRCEDGKVSTRPIAGTRPRGKDEAEDQRLARQLLADAKERAEHLMLVDLGRNDLGRVSAYASVKVEEFMTVEKYSHVMHLVSHVTGRLKRGRDAWDALAACFPAGTLSGAPKIRAMEIIDELETVRRGPYGGAIGYFGFSGNLDSCIIIRTMVIKGGRIYIQAGAGIVADSDPDREYQESVNKARALMEALGAR
ncbi:MAG: anthranilate synthase component I [Deltaproteobacteria bacterium]